ncbi:hypothetical protein [Metabacillus niabensis]|uniref:hypothetical protein n=1 Tax=Metabacillus niabensis TaxID=324854 RepID=UPI00299DA884|nr:hypothetical protein [Metabacillus niabensis]
MYISPQVSRKEDMYYGLGWRISTKENDSYIFHGGETPDSRSELLVNPEKKYGFILLTNKNNFSEVLQTTYMKEGIKAIIENGKLPESPKVTHHMQWITLFCTILLAMLSVWNLFVLKRKSTIRKKMWIVIGVSSIICSITIIPALTYIFGAPWHTITYYAPDTAFLIKCLVAVFACNGFILLSIMTLKKKKRNFFKKRIHEDETSL